MISFCPCVGKRYIALCYAFHNWYRWSSQIMTLCFNDQRQLRKENMKGFILVEGEILVIILPVVLKDDNPVVQ